MLVVAIAATSAAGVLHSQSLWHSEAILSTDAAQCRIAARAGIAWAAAVLQQDARTSTVDHLDEPWAQPLPSTHVQDLRVEGAIQDLQGRYNLNNLVRSGSAQPREIARYKRLLLTLRLPTALAEALADWMDADQLLAGQDGAEDEYYLALAASYRTSGQPLADVNELLRVKGYTPAVVAALRPYVAALPGHSAINVNTAPAETLMLVSEQLTFADALLLGAQRKRSHFRTVADFTSLLPRTAAMDADMVRVTSEYFMVDAHVKRGAATVHAQAIVHRAVNAWPSVVWQRFGG